MPFASLEDVKFEKIRMRGFPSGRSHDLFPPRLREEEIPDLGPSLQDQIDALKEEIRELKQANSPFMLDPLTLQWAMSKYF